MGKMPCHFLTHKKSALLAVWRKNKFSRVFKLKKIKFAFLHRLRFPCTDQVMESRAQKKNSSSLLPTRPPATFWICHVSSIKCQSKASSTVLTAQKTHWRSLKSTRLIAAQGLLQMFNLRIRMLVWPLLQLSTNCSQGSGIRHWFHVLL